MLNNQFLDEEKEYYTGYLNPGSDTIKNGSLVSGVTWIAGSISKYAVSFASGPATSGQYIVINNDPSLMPYSGLTISLWFSPASTSQLGAFPSLVSHEHTTNGSRQGYQIIWGSGTIPNLRFETYSGAVIAFSCQSENFTFSSGIWYHVVGRFDITANRRSSLFLNNQLNISGGGTNLIGSDPQLLYIGADSSGGTNFFGSIDEVRIYNRALENTEIGSLYELKNVTKGLVGYWSFDEGTGSIAYDYADGNFSYFNSGINGTIDEISFLPSTSVTAGSLFVLVSGTNEQLAFFNSGISNSNYTIIYPDVYAVDNQANSGSPWAKMKRVINAPINIIGSNMYETQVKIHYR